VLQVIFFDIIVIVTRVGAHCWSRDRPQNWGFP